MDQVKEHALQALLPLFQNSEECSLLREQLQEANREIAVLQERCRMLEKRARQQEHQAQRFMRANATAKGRLAGFLVGMAAQGREMINSLDASAYDEATEAQPRSAQQRSYDDQGAGKLAFLRR